MRMIRRRRAFCLILAATLLVVTFMFTQSFLQKSHLRTVIADDNNFILDMAPLSGQLRYLNFIVQENSTTLPTRCQPVYNIAFVKTHKAGSSTIANILQRYGITRGLNFVLPNKMYHVYAYNYITKPGEILTMDKIIPIPEGQVYNILYNHAIYNRTAFHKIMPKNTSYITILREPFQQFVSAFEYYNVKNIFATRNSEILNETNPISAYLENPIKFETRLTYFSYIKNKQAEDLGLGIREFFSPGMTKDYISQMDKDFSLVMIMEHFDESLLLLKRQLCWEIKDILYIPKNTNKHKPYRNFTTEDYVRHRNLSHLDYSLYSHYLDIFNNKLRSLGEDFNQEVANFKQLLHQVASYCLKKMSLHVEATRWYAAFDITDDDCKLMILSELAGLDMLFARAGKRMITASRKFDLDSRGQRNLQQIRPIK